MITNIHKVLNLDGEERRRASVYLFGIFHLYDIEEVRELTIWEGWFCSVRWTYSALAEYQPPAFDSPVVGAPVPGKRGFIPHGGARARESVNLIPKRSPHFEWLLVRGKQFYEGGEYLIDFLKHAYTKCYTKGEEDSTRIKTNPIVRIAIFIGALTTLIVFIKALQYGWPIWMDIFLGLQLGRILCYLGSESEVQEETQAIEPEILLPGEEEDHEDRDREYSDDREWVSQRQEYDPYS